MIGQHFTDEPHFPDTGRDLATGASVVMAVAAAIALVLAVLVASLSTAGTAGAATLTGPQPVRPLIIAEPTADGRNLIATGILTPTPATYRIEAVLPARDGTFSVAGPLSGSDSSLAWGVLAFLGLAALAATRAAGGALLARIRPRRRPAAIPT